MGYIYEKCHFHHHNTFTPPRPSQNHALGRADKAETEVEFNN